jgi:hypothetical protein
MKLPANSFNPSSPKTPEVRAGEGSEGGHWYMPGPPVQCAYEILGVNGKWRATHLGDARKFGWFPGASSIVRIEAAPQLERWKIRQAVLSALTHPKVGEIKDAEELFLMIERDSHEQVKQAAARGTAIHKAIENFIAEGVVDPQYEPYITAVRRELFLLSGVDDRHAWRTEVAVTHPYGFGGRIDLVSEELGWTVDLKGKEFGVDDEIKGYPEQCRQLAAYREAKVRTSRTANIYISRNHPGLVRAFEWSEEESAKAWKEFCVLLTFWQLKNNMPLRTMQAA